MNFPKHMYGHPRRYRVSMVNMTTNGTAISRSSFAEGWLQGVCAEFTKNVRQSDSQRVLVFLCV